jgi:hypothetical protein
MSTAFYPTNMRQMPAGGYNHKSTLENIPYRSWKGTGPFSNPVGVTASHIRPLTNNDPGNIFPTGFGLARPIKHYRKGTVIPIHFQPNPNDNAVEDNLIMYNVNRSVKSSNGSSLGGGSGGQGLIAQLIEQPGIAIVKDNETVNPGTGLFNTTDPLVETTDTINKECANCQGVGFVSDWYPINNLTEKPQQNVTNPLLCCNQQRKAIQRVLPASTNVKKNYYQTTGMYLYNRCQTFGQREFNFVNGPVNQQIQELFLSYPFVTAKIIEFSKPGDPLSLVNQYVAQCNPNFTVEIGAEVAFISSLSKILFNEGFINETMYQNISQSTNLSVAEFIQVLYSLLEPNQYEIVIEYLYQLAANPYNGSFLSGPSNPKGCAQVYYKPNNPQFAKQGAVSSSTRMLKLNVDTITTAAAQQRRLKSGTNLQATTASTPFIYKDKVPSCNPSAYIGNPFFFSGQHQNKKICSKTTGDEYKNFVSVYQHGAANVIGNTMP